MHVAFHSTSPTGFARLGRKELCDRSQAIGCRTSYFEKVRAVIWDLRPARSDRLASRTSVLGDDAFHAVLAVWVYSFYAPATFRSRRLLSVYPAALTPYSDDYRESVADRIPYEPAGGLVKVVATPRHAQRCLKHSGGISRLTLLLCDPALMVPMRRTRWA